MTTSTRLWPTLKSEEDQLLPPTTPSTMVFAMCMLSATARRSGNTCR
jgi:hypothetical protein